MKCAHNLTRGIKTVLIGQPKFTNDLIKNEKIMQPLLLWGYYGLYPNSLVRHLTNKWQLSCWLHIGNSSNMAKLKLKLSLELLYIGMSTSPIC